MKKELSVDTEALLIGRALVLLTLSGLRTTQAQDVNTLPSPGGWVGVGMPDKTWTATIGPER